MEASQRKKLLVLAGTAEARRLCDEFSRLPQLEILASLAGRTTRPSKYLVPTRIGGFGGPKGLAEFVRSERFDAIIDATHPFAVQISCNAIAAASQFGIPIVRLDRPEWVPGNLDNWAFFDELSQAVEMIPGGSRVLAAIGGQSIENPLTADALRYRADVTFLVRAFESPSRSSVPANCIVLTERPSPNLEHELRLLRREKITCLLCRNSGSEAGRHKLDAAAQCNLPVYMLSKPMQPELPRSGVSFTNIGELKKWIYDRILYQNSGISYRLL